MSNKEFENLVEEGVKAIPEKFLQLLDNVAVVVADEPSDRQRNRLSLADEQILYGLYEGVPRVQRGSGYSGTLPDKITIFKNSILLATHSVEEARALIKQVVWHELAHHFGMDEKHVRDSEARRQT